MLGSNFSGRLVHLVFLLTALELLSAAPSDAQRRDEGEVNQDSFGFSHKRPDKRRKVETKLPAGPVVPVEPEVGVIKVDTVLVVNDVAVFDRDGQQVKKLKKSDFKIYE